MPSLVLSRRLHQPVLLTALLMVLSLKAARAQVGLGTTTPDAKAALDIRATDKGLLIPRLTEVQRTALTSVPDGLLVFQTDGTTGFWYCFGGVWTSIPNVNTLPAGESTTAGNGLALVGNDVQLGGTLTSTTTVAQNNNFLGLTGGKIGLGTGNDLQNSQVSVAASSPNENGLYVTLNGASAANSLKIEHNGSNFIVRPVAGSSASTVIENTAVNGSLSINPSAGNVGIGTTSPAQRLDVNGNALISGTLGINTGDGDKVYLTNALSAGSKISHSSNWTIDYNAGPGLSSTTTRGFHRFFTTVAGGFQERMRVDASGNVGIGTTSPTQRLDVTGNTNVTGNSYTSGSVGIGTTAPAATLHVAGGSSTVRLAGLAGTGTRVVTTDASGNLGSTTTASLADNLGNHNATQRLNLAGYALTGTGSSISDVGVGVRADGGLNLGQNGEGNNILVGYQAGNSLSTGFGSLFVGVGAGQAVSTGVWNVMQGYEAGVATTTGNYNTFVGFKSGTSNVAGSDNTYLGHMAGELATGSPNHFVGHTAGGQTTTGTRNTFEGYSSGQNNTTGSNNLALGYSAGPTTGGLTNAGAIGYEAQVSQSNSLVLGGIGTNAVSVGIGTTAPAATLHVAGSSSTVRLAGLAGTGTRVVTTDASGNLGSTALPATESTTATNGLSLSGTAVQLGGTLSATTTVAQAGNPLYLTGGKIGLGLSTDPNLSRVSVGAASAGENGLFVKTFDNTPTASSLKLEHNGSNLVVRPASAGGSTTIVENSAGNLSLNPTGGNTGLGTTAPSSTLHIAGSEASAYVTTGTSTSFTLGSSHRTVRRFGTCTTITVPAASTCPGRLYTLINSNGQGSFTLTVTGGGTVYDDITNTTFSGTNAFPAGTRLTIQSDGSGWLVVGR